MLELVDNGETGAVFPQVGFAITDEARIRLSDFLASMRSREIKHGTDGDDAGRINFRVRHVVMTLDMIEIDGVGDAGLLI